MTDSCRFGARRFDVISRGTKHPNPAKQEAVVPRQNTISQDFKSIAGAVFIGLGAFILFRNLCAAASQLSRLLGITADEADALGVLAAGSMAATRALQAYLFHHTEFLRGLNQILLSFWPLVLIIVGTIVLRAALWGEAKDLPKKNDYWTCRFHCPSFDVKVGAG
jgi:hypothetical protein